MNETAPKQQTQIKAKKPTALIAGGAGFIGSHLCETLISQNFNVICVDNLSTGKKENIKSVLTNPNFTFIEGNINDQNFYLAPSLEIDYCFHLASIEEFAQSENFSLDTLLVNSLGTRQLLEIAKDNNAKFILFSAADLYSGAISTSSLRYYFGKSPEGESVLSFHEAKRFAEALSFEYFKKFNLDITIIRLKDVYGPRMNLDAKGEIEGLLKAAINKETLKIYGDGLKTVNPTFVSDVIFASVKAAVGSYNGEIFNLVNPEKVTIESFAQTLKLVAGPLEIERKKDKTTLELPESHFDLTNTKEKLGWNPKVSLAEGISTLIQARQLPIDKTVEESPKLDENRLVEPNKEKSEAAVEKKVKNKTSGVFLRIVIFAASLLLLIFTVVYPTLAISVGSVRGRQSLMEASNSFNSGNNASTITTSTSAQKSFEIAEKNLQNLSWLLKMIGFGEKSANFDRVIGISINLSESLKNTAKANSVLITTSEKNDLTPVEAKSKLEEALDYLYQSRSDLEEAQLLAESVDWSKTPRLISPDQNFIKQEIKNLNDQIAFLIKQIEGSLATS